MFRTPNHWSFKFFPNVWAIDLALQFMVVLEVRHSLANKFFKLSFVDVVSRSVVLGNCVKPYWPCGDYCCRSIAVICNFDASIHFYAFEEIILSLFSPSFLCIDIDLPLFYNINPFFTKRLIQKIIIWIMMMLNLTCYSLVKSTWPSSKKKYGGFNNRQSCLFR